MENRNFVLSIFLLFILLFAGLSIIASQNTYVNEVDDIDDDFSNIKNETIQIQIMENGVVKEVNVTYTPEHGSGSG